MHSCPTVLSAAVAALERAHGRVPPADRRRAFAAFRDAVQDGLRRRERTR